MRTLSLLVLALTVSHPGGNAAAADAVDFNRDVRPLLAENCFQCHGPDAEAREAGLRLDVRDDALRARSSNPAITPGEPQKSLLLTRVTSTDAGLRMPPDSTGKTLSAEAVDTLERWIAEGASYTRHWSLDPIRRPPPPPVVEASGVRNAIDLFVRSRLETEQVAPSPPAGRATLARRLSLDLLGLPPHPELVDEFVADRRPDAYGRLVERLLASPHFGERWGRHWLDQARYADSHGYTNDGPRSMWPYRDWVIQSFNDDQPFDAFTIEQLAGDLLPAPTLSQRIATGFHRNTLINTEGGTKPDQFRVEQAKDRVDTTGVVWLGLTVGCAKCHSHKYDPIEQREYYQLYAFFNSTKDENSTAPMVRVPTPQQAERLATLTRELEQREAALAELTEPERTAAAQGIEKLKATKKSLEDSIATTMVLEELEKPRPTHVQVRGEFLRPGEPVDAGVPAALPPLQKANTQRGTRLDLAHWLTDNNNPLTARVRVNRIWMRLFGRGLVETENDFGTQGALPTHPRLLDWLASEFVAGGWSTKALIRTIVMSATYRQSSKTRQDLDEVDPSGKLLATQRRLRVEAEIVRDLGLAASGLLEATIGGPSVYPPQPDGVYAFTQHDKKWKVSPGADRFRRGMYTFFYRSAPHPLLSTFDVPKFNETCTQRDRSNTPLQSLTLANDEALFEMARGLAARGLRSGDASSDTERIETMFRWCLARPPHQQETSALLEYLDRQRARFRARPGDAERLQPSIPGAAIAAVEGAAWTAVARVLLNLDEFVTRE